MKDWKTTILGLLFAIAAQIEPWIDKGEIPSKDIIILSFGLAIVGYFSKDRG